jgi:dTDP-4-dehydrorhamnose reductase
LKILIVGSGGQLGRCLVRGLDTHQLVSLDHAALDVTAFRAVRDALFSHQPDLVINASAFNDVDGAESRVDEAYAVNVKGPRNLALATAELGIQLVHVSTDYVFDGAMKRPYNEFDPTNPLSVYGASKLAGEEVVRSLNSQHYIVRTAWLFSEYGSNFLLSMYRKASHQKLNVESDRYGSPTYVPHLAAGIARLIESGMYGTYHLAGGGKASRWNLVHELFERLKRSTLVVPVSHTLFHAIAPRPAYSVLASAQSFHIELPPWREGVAEFAHRLSLLKLERSGMRIV